MASKYAQSAVLILAILGVFLWAISPSLSPYNLQLTGALILLYFVSRILFRRVSRSFYLATVIFVSIALLLIFSTGGINSPLFFILDFLLFAIALLLSPQQAVVTSLTLVGVFLWQNYSTITSPIIINLLSLILITPLAVIFGKSYLNNLQSAGKISVLKEAIKDEQTDSLLWISTTAKPSLANVLNSITDVVIYFNTLSQSTKVPKALVEKLKKIQNDLISLYASTGTLEKSIEESSDKMEL